MHSTKNIDDGYEGSGNWIGTYKKKYGKGVLIKEILHFFQTRDDAASFERKLVTEELIRTDRLCMNQCPGGSGFSPESASKINKGRTADKDPGKARTVAQLTGRTKETHVGLRIAGEKISAQLTGRTKETHQYIADVANVLRGRNKENHPGVKRQSEKIRGRTKETHSGVAAQAQKKRKLSVEQDVQIFELRNSGMTINEVRKTLKLEHVPYQSISTAYNRAKQILSK